MEIMRKTSYEVEKTTQRACELLESESEELICNMFSKTSHKMNSVQNLPNFLKVAISAAG